MEVVRVSSGSVLFMVLSTVFNFSNYNFTSSSRNYTAPHWEHVLHDSTDHWTLYQGKTVLEDLFYLNSKVDSFIFKDYLSDKSCSGGVQKGDSLYAQIGFWREADYMRHDSLFFNCWQPVEPFFSYHYQIKKDNITIWEKAFENTPVFPFSVKQSEDSLIHIYMMHITARDNNGKEYSHIAKLWKEEGKKISFTF